MRLFSVLCVSWAQGKSHGSLGREAFWILGQLRRLSRSMGGKEAAVGLRSVAHVPAVK